MPPAVIVLSPTAAKARLHERPSLLIVDVRPRPERALASIDAPYRTLDPEDGGLDGLLALPKDTPLAFLCHHAVRSAQAAEYFLAQGFSEVCNVEGGIEAWSSEVDPRIPRY